jgi:hypothetical protein
MEAEQSLTLEQFAEQVRKDCAEIIGAMAAGDYADAETLIEALCTRSSDVARAGQMTAEAGADYDLAALNSTYGSPE